MKLRLLTSCLLLLGLIGSAQAEEGAPQVAAKPDCGSFEACYHLALRLYKAEKIAEALPAFEAAYAFRPEPNLLINIGRAHYKLGHAPDALDYYERYRTATPTLDAIGKARLQQYISEAQELLAKTAPAASSPPAPPPPPAAAEPSKEAPTASPPPDSALPPTATSAATAAPTTAVVIAHPPKRPIYKKWWFWTLIGAAVAGAVTAGVVVGTQSSMASDLNGIDVRLLHF